MSTRLFVFPTAFFLAGLAAAGSIPSPTLAATWVVDGGDADCTDAGPGDSMVPFCSIKRAASSAAAADTVLVHPATYREQVTVPRSGAADLPITYRAQEAGALILGTDDLSDPAGWSPTATSAWSRLFVPASAPTQVFVDGARLTTATAANTTVPGSFFYDAAAGVLYVDVGGPNPADGHVVEAGARTYGFSVVGRSHIVIEGFEFRGQNHTGVRLATGSSNLVVRRNSVSQTGVNGILSDASVGPVLIEANVVSLAGSVGIRLLNSTGVVVSGNDSHRNANHGLALQGSSDNSITNNISYLNARPTVRAANGLDVNGMSLRNTIRANTFFDNQDSGCQIYNGSNDNLVVRNVSYRNGDHGFDTNQATGTRYVSNTSHGNFKTGFSVEGFSTGTVLANNIAVDNGLQTDESDLFVDQGSTAGFVSDYDILYRSGPGSVVSFAGVRYAILGDFAAATGHEAHGLGEDPMFLDAASGNLQVGIGPAVDSADSGASGFSTADHGGSEPVDISGVANTGAGEIPYADRGAFELVDPPPVAVLKANPRGGLAPLLVVASAAESSDDKGIVSYLFDFGDGSTVGPQKEPIAAHVYLDRGTFTLSVAVTDTAGQTARASVTITVKRLL